MLASTLRTASARLENSRSLLSSALVAAELHGEPTEALESMLCDIDDVLDRAGLVLAGVA